MDYENILLLHLRQLKKCDTDNFRSLMNNLVLCEVDLELSLVLLIEIASCQVEEINLLILF
jgi:hypothetical protein